MAITGQECRTYGITTLNSSQASCCPYIPDLERALRRTSYDLVI